MSVQLARSDFDQLQKLLLESGVLRTPFAAQAFLDAALAGSPRATDLFSQINLGGDARVTATEIINKFCKFGQDVPGREALAFILDQLKRSVGEQDSAFLDRLAVQYRLMIPPDGHADAPPASEPPPETMADPSVNPVTLRDVLARLFTKDELAMLCFDLNPELQRRGFAEKLNPENLGAEGSKTIYAQKLIAFFESRDVLEVLVRYVRGKRANASFS